MSGSALQFASVATHIFTTRVKIENEVWVPLSKHEFLTEKSPYREGALMSTDLWVRLVNHSVIVQVVVDPRKKKTKDLEVYRQRLLSLGARVVIVSSEGIDCPLVAQNSRLLGCSLAESDQDIHPTES